MIDFNRSKDTYRILTNDGIIERKASDALSALHDAWVEKYGMRECQGRNFSNQGRHYTEYYATDDRDVSMAVRTN